MSTPVRIQRSRKKGSRLTSPNGLPVVCVTRPGKWGNPFRSGDAKRNVSAFALWLDTPKGRQLVIEARKELAGRNLACWCAPVAPCHADVLLELVNA